MWVKIGKTFFFIYVSIHCNFLYNEVIEIIFIIREELTKCCLQSKKKRKKLCNSNTCSPFKNV